MSAPTPDEFDRMMNEEFPVNHTPEYVDPNPYGIPSQPVKTGLTTRGKAALGIGAAVIAGGSLIGYQAYSADAAAAQAKAQEIALQSQQLELEKLKELNRASESQQNTLNAQDKARQASVDSCVKDHSGQVGKGFGSPTYREVIDDCQTLYPATTSTDGMESTASTTAASDATNTGGVNEGVLIGGGALALFVLVAARRGTRNEA